MQTFNLDLSAKRIIAKLYAKQRDVGSKICVKLTDNEVEYVVPDGVTWSVWYSGASGEGNYDKIDGRDAVVVDAAAGTASVELIYQMLDNPGPGEMCLVMNSADGTQLGLWNIPYFVEAIPGADSVAAVQYYQAFLQAQAKAEAAAERSEEAAERAEAGAGASIIVGLDEGDVATHTAAEIYNAIENKQPVVYRHDDRLGSEFISLKTAKPNVAVFSKTGYPTEFDIFNIEIDAKGTVSYKTSFSSDLVEQAVEKVETDKAPVSYLPQAATEEQQAQARENIKAATIDDTKAGTDAWSSKNIVDRLCPAFTENGSAVTCEPVEGYPLEVISKIEPVQSGTGDPGPDNIRPISGHSKVKLTQSGKNLMQLDTVERIEDRDYWNWEHPVTFEGVLQAPFTISGDYSQADTSSAKFGEGAALLELIVDGKEVYVTGLNLGKEDFTVTSGTLTKITAINWCEVTGTVKLQLEKGTTATKWEAHRNETFTMDLGQTVYGGTLDWNTGVLTVDKKVLVVDGTELSFATVGDYWNLPRFCAPGIKSKNGCVNSHFMATCFGTNGTYGFPYVYAPRFTYFASVDELNAYLVEQDAAGTPLTILYELEAPIAIQLTPQEITALSGSNTLYSDTGNTEVAGKANPVSIINNLQDRLAGAAGAKGDKGDKGDTGAQGVGIVSVNIEEVS